MTELLTAAQMRAAERAAMDAGTSGLTLMERAGRGLTEAIFAEWPDLDDGPRRAVVLCGPGNNGGDGFVIARRLADRGWRVEVFLFGDPETLPPDAKANHDIWARMGGVRPLDPEAAAAGDRPALLVDALFGTGLGRPIPRDCARAFHAVRARTSPPGARHARLRVVAVDCPSGLDCDTGEVLLPPSPGDGDSEGDPWTAWWTDEAAPRLLRADLTATFHRAKVGHYLGQAPGTCGALRVIDIGLDEERTVPIPVQPPEDRVRLAGPDHLGARLPGRVWPGHVLPARGGHKYDRGHVLVLGGGPGRGGAARLAARAALRIGAGLVTLACPPEALMENAARLDAIMLKPVADAEALAGTLKDDRLGVVLLGPGLGVGGATRALVRTALGTAAEPERGARRFVLDADALTSFAGDPEALFAHLPDSAVLTPHEGEFARLFPDLAQADRAAARLSKVDAARRAADRAGCTILLKGPDTVIASPGGAASVHAAAYGREARWLGTAGAGDVLAGMIAGLLAPSGTAPHPHVAAEAAAWLHVEAARAFGPGLVAEDLPETLPRVFRDLGL